MRELRVDYRKRNEQPFKGFGSSPLEGDSSTTSNKNLGEFESWTMQL